MPAIIVDQPWPPELGEVLRTPDGRPVVCPTTGRTLRAHRHQLIIWATFTAGGNSPPAAGAPLFPLLLDTGFNDAFLMQQRQAEMWLAPGAFAAFKPRGRFLPVGREQIPGWDVALWVYPNVPGTRDPNTSRPPVWLDLPLGATLTPPGSAHSKEKQLFGLRGIRFNQLVLHIDGAAGTFSLDGP